MCREEGDYEQVSIYQYNQTLKSPDLSMETPTKNCNNSEILPPTFGSNYSGKPKCLNK